MSEFVEVTEIEGEESVEVETETDGKDFYLTSINPFYLSLFALGADVRSHY